MKNILFPIKYSIFILLLTAFSANARMTTSDSVITFNIKNTKSSRITFEGSGLAVLTNINSNVGSWYTLEVTWPNESLKKIYHLEVSDLKSVSNITLVSTGLQFNVGQNKVNCNLLVTDDKNNLKSAASVNSAYVPLCNNKISLRQKTKGSAGGLTEWGANFLRDNLGSVGEGIVDTYKDLRTVEGDKAQVLGRAAGSNSLSQAELPPKAKLSAAYIDSLLKVSQLDLSLKENSQNGLNPGSWYELKNQEGMYFSFLQPNMIEDSIMNSFKSRVDNLESTENNALSYMVAIDLSKYDMGWSHGTRLPGVGWSDRNLSGKNANPNLKGPDGFDNLDPLAMSGSLNPNYLSRLAGTMCGGFQRHHSAFKWGEFAQKNNGSYYGFIQEGVVLSQLNPGLATVIIYNDGKTEIKSWSTSDEVNLPKIRYARQNGVPLIDSSEAGVGVPGAYVNQWGPGNWSGSVGKDLLTPRAGACIVHRGSKPYLIYGYFSAGTPSSMARVFQAYSCEYAIHLDMNSAGQGYLGLFSHVASGYKVEHPVKEMAGRDTPYNLGGNTIKTPRYVGTPDEADFFYLLRK